MLKIGSLEKLELGAPSSSATPKETVSARGGYLRVRFDLLSSINFRNISNFPKLGPVTLIIGHPRGPRVVVVASLTQGHTHFLSGCGFMNKLKLYTKFEVSTFIHCANIEVKPQNFGELT